MKFFIAPINEHFNASLSANYLILIGISLLLKQTLALTAYYTYNTRP
jgi:hypothetical protein